MTIKNGILIAIAVILPMLWVVTHKKTTPTNPLEMNSIVVGTSGDYPPFSFIQNNKLVGFDIALAEEIAHRLGKGIEFKDMAFINLVPELQRGTIHLIAAGMTPSPERAKRIAFTKPHIEGTPLVIVSKTEKPYTSLAELEHKPVVVNEGYTADSFITSWGKANILRLTSPADAFLALKSGRAYAYVDAKTAVIPFFTMYGTEEFTMTAIENTGESSALGVSPKFPEFQEKVQAILNAMATDGTIEQLKKTWGIA